MVKRSRFNFWASLDGDTHLLFNGMTGALYEMTAQERAIAESLLADEVPFHGVEANDSELCGLLIEGGFLVPSGLDEIESLLSESERECRQPAEWDIVVCPTYACNMRCTYCYVDFAAERMDQDTERRLLLYLKGHIPRFRQVNLSWFGGEPLLCLDTVTRVSREAGRIADKRGVVLVPLLTTNGYLLSQQVARSLRDSGIRHFHITVDGPPSEHDRRRQRAGGKGTFDVIWRNLLALLETVDDAHLTLRMNCDLGNVDRLTELLDLVPESFRSRIQVNVAAIRGSGESPAIGLLRRINQVIHAAVNRGYLYSEAPLPVGRRTFCGADKECNFQVGPGGTLFKCSPGHDKSEVKVGFLGSDGNPVLETGFERWHAAPNLQPECIDCSYLCFCVGGCRLERLRGVQRANCRDDYRDMNQLILNRYLALRQEAEAGREGGR